MRQNGKLHLASGPELITRDHATYAAWGKLLTLEQYLAREQALRGAAYTRKAMKTWFWMGPEGQVLSSCETFELPSRLGDSSGVSYGIASVYTEEQHRGHGYASELIEAVCQKLGHAQAIHLYSEVGDKIYRRVGFELLPSYEWEFDARAGESRLTGANPQTVLQSANELLATQPGLAIFPTLECIEWHWVRARFYAEHLGRQVPTPEMYTIEVPGQFASLWTADVKRNAWRALLWVEAPGFMGARQVIDQAAARAHAHGFSRVCVWETGSSLDLARAGGRRLHRDEDLAMVRPALEWNEVQRAHWV